ncbi:MAG: thiamine-phosphate kinase [Deltaproteobacteria bacterium]|nr:thiamine-phosphate kinase [Deltaproteobacteria bacterium]MBW2253085.1 thiamine-phosphate kinase [Deltaproteobacteria bacterium]
MLRAIPEPPVSVQVGPGDDAAVVQGQAITVDALVEGVHWNDRLGPEDVGYKSVAVSVSDLAAMGARPAWVVLALSVPAPVDLAWVEALATGVGSACRSFAVALVGGDVTRSPGPRYLSVTMGGPCPRPVTRSGAHAGDWLWVTGTLGLAGAGYLLDAPPPEALEALRRPRPPLPFALALADAGLASAMMDLSDGLATDLPRLCAASGLGGQVDPRSLPLHPTLGRIEDPVPLQVGAGDDYELMFTAPPQAEEQVRALAEKNGVAVTAIGSLTSPGPVELIGRPWPPSFSHFGASTPGEVR